MNILIACEFSGVVRDAFIERGHNAVSCDLLPSERPGPHIQGDVRPLLSERWDLIIAHPPCTYLSQAGARWLFTEKPNPPNRADLAREAALFMRLFLDAPAQRIAVENPMMNSIGKSIVGEPTQTVRESHFGGHGTKRICLWTKGLPPLLGTLYNPYAIDLVGRRTPKELSPLNKTNQRDRSRTDSGLANAMAAQWG